MTEIDRRVRRSFKIRRYLSLRYLNAILLFINIYWIINILSYRDAITLIIPIMLLLTDVLLLKDLYATFKEDVEVDLERSRKIYILNIIVMAMVGIVCMFDYTLMYPYMAGRMYALIVVAATLIFLFLALLKVNAIISNKDKVYKKYQEYLKSQNKIKEKGSKVKYV